MAVAVVLSAAVANAAAPAGVFATDFSSPRSWTHTGHLRTKRIHLRDGNALQLSGSGRLSQSLGMSNPGALSLDVLVPAGSRLALNFGSRRLTIAGARHGTVSASAGSWHARLARRRGWAAGGWRHIELAASGARPLAIDGRALPAPLKLSGPLVVRAPKGSPRIAALVVSRRGFREGLLANRLATLHARTRLGEYPWGSDAHDRTLHFSDGWTSGFWPGSLWREYLDGGNGLFYHWALAATLKHLGGERAQIHDVGFEYIESSARAYDEACPGSGPGTFHASAATCRRLRSSALAAANTLLKLQAGNRAAGTIPTLPPGKKCRMCHSKAEAETLVDSMMNVGLVEWAYDHTHAAKYRTAALAHARGVERMLVRPDGSTAQAVRTRRSDGKVLGTETHQGISAKSTWSRGQAWAIYGFANTGTELNDAESVHTAERAAEYVEAHLPAGGVPPYDYAAPHGRPIDTSAGIVTADGLYRLAAACGAVPGGCRESDAAHWRSLADRMYAASIRHVSAHPPFGFLSNEVFSLGGSASWDDSGDFSFGTAYALDAYAVRAAG